MILSDQYWMVKSFSEQNGFIVTLLIVDLSVFCVY